MYSDRRLLLVVALLILLWLSGIAGYAVIEGWGLLDSLYMTAISLTTVGYGEVHPLSPMGRFFTVLLLTTGVGLFLYSVGVLAEATVEGRLKGILERRKMEKRISKLAHHFIVCGYGRIGKTICRVISEKNIAVVVIENDPAILRDLAETDLLFVNGDATQDAVLLKAGVERAKGIVCVLRSDADNVYITLTARGLNPGLFIQARAEDPEAEKKMIQAGADRVISPYAIGARRMALALLQPTVTEFLDLAVHTAAFDLTIEQVEIETGSWLDGASIADADIRQKIGVTILAVQQSEGRMIVSPDPEYVLRGEDIVVALGKSENLHSLADLAQKKGG